MRFIEWEHLTIEPEETEDRIVLPVMVNQSPIQNQNLNLYVGHTNFKLNLKKDLAILNNIDGIEIVRILTRYRFVICIGECFDFSIIANDIEEKLGCLAKIEKDIDPKIFNLLVKETEKISAKTPYWCLYLFPNGKIDYWSGNSEDELLEKLIFYDECKKLSDGVIIWPKDVEIKEDFEKGQ